MTRVPEKFLVCAVSCQPTPQKIERTFPRTGTPFCHSCPDTQIASPIDSTAPCLCRPHRHTLQRLSFSLIQHPVASCRDSSARKIFLACAVSCHPTPQKIEQRASTHTHTHTRAHEQTLLPLTFPDRETASPVAPCRCRLPDPPAGAGVVCVRVCLCLLHQRLFSTLHKHTYPPNSSVDPPPYTRCILIGRKCGRHKDFLTRRTCILIGAEVVTLDTHCILIGRK